MPRYLYAFECENRHQFDEYVNMDDRHEARPCPSCGADSRKLLVATPFVFRGEFHNGPPGAGNKTSSVV